MFTITRKLAAAGLALTLALAVAAPAEAQRSDAASSAEFTARTSVQTIYHNLIKAGYEWEYIRDEKMPEILIRAVDAVKRETGKFDRKLIVGTFIPTFVRTYYEEIDKLNAQHQARCIDVKFLEITLIPFLEACVNEFSGEFTVREIVVPVLETRYTFTVCDSRPVCLKRLSDSYNTAFASATLAERDFENVCTVSGR